MAYDSTVPATGHSGSQDYNAMRGNFAQIQNSFSKDHEPLGTGGGVDGFHLKSTYVSQSGDPAPVSGAGIAYTKTPGSHTELFYEGEAGTGKVLQITNQSLTASSGQGMLPGGLQIRTGSGTLLLDNANHAFTYSAFPVATLIGIAIPDGSNITNQIQTVSSAYTNSSVTFKCVGGGSIAIKFIAIGY